MPCVSGGCALLRQYFINQGSAAPSPAMTKAFLMNSARYLNGPNAADTLWSDTQGMGELNLGMAFDGAPRVVRDELAADVFTASGAKPDVQRDSRRCLQALSRDRGLERRAWLDHRGGGL